MLTIFSHNHYLDVQFRLLREDFVRPLREGIDYYRGEGEKVWFSSTLFSLLIAMSPLAPR